MPYSDAVAFCRNLDLSRGGGARLPTLEEYEDLARAMRSIVPGGYYIPEVIPDMKEHEFWTSTIQKNIYSTEKIRSFSGELGEVNIWTSLGMSLKSAFRCVRDA
jgi:formylglycine-generating enzyme required for sulfatase activity